MHNLEVRNERIVHVLPEERLVVKGIERYSVRAGKVSQRGLHSRHSVNLPYSFTRSSWDFLGITSSICGASRGYVSATLVRIARWAEDFTLDLAPAEILDGS